MELTLDQALQRGIEAHKAGQVQEADRYYTAILKADPKHPDANHNMGVLAVDVGKVQEALPFFKRALEANSSIAQYWLSNINALIKLGRVADAKALFDQAKSNGIQGDGFDKLEQQLAAKGKDQEPTQTQVQTLIDLYTQGQHQETINQASQLLGQFPNSINLYNIMGAANQSLGNLEKAIEAFSKALAIKPDYTEAYNNMGNALKDQGKLEDAILAHNKALSLKPDYADAYNNLGIALQDQNKIKESIDAYKKALVIKPDDAEIHQNLSFMLLRNGKIKEGLAEYEWRWKTKEGLSRQRFFSKPQWNGETSLKDKKILLWSEQGIGDTLNWSSCLPLLNSQAKQCIMECQDKLVPLLQRSFPEIDVIPVNRILDSERDDFDLHLPMGSLYSHFINKIMQNVKPDAFLVPNPERVNFWKERLDNLGKGPYIGISWKSSVVSAYRRHSYPNISEWSPVLTIPDVTFINLQYIDYEDDLSKVQDEFGVTIHNFNDLDQYDDIDDVAALCKALDMVVSTKVAPPFISSAVGTPTKIANWRQSSYNNILTNPVTSSYDMFDRDTWETWGNVFNSIAENIFELKNKITNSKYKL